MLSSVLPASKKTARITSLSLPGPDAGRPSGYTTRVYALGLAVRFIHLAGIILLVGASGHAAAVEPGTARALGVDGVHLLAASVWVGGLPPLLLLLRAAG